ncbi:MAG: FAD-binding oxidoreductase, partial [Actinobacteria bacterium]|nr:FAD-binding oxidoreductase [Actinomycetota bacterium]NIS35292.1 FAD-binding oxidoreductase [Actinomycetota bacterium]NIT98042.1 FAD-binding oxidoreductase [Actinomycetota bacterium]NIU21676.1 FAD-binding oxidoreductase [Actinomycetota bacterium]NIU69997.1 FAD-binding oxidoreductase [Actinomycetota bacterium]
VDRDPYRTDEWQRVGALPVAVALPRTTEEVAAVVTACSEAGAAVVTQGGHTGLSGGAQVTGD